jgi:predicted nucleic-acid-binding Zn-ribbon protein
MKNTKRCPKCGSQDVYKVEAVIGHTYGAGNVIPTGLLGTIKVNRYVKVKTIFQCLIYWSPRRR